MSLRASEREGEGLRASDALPVVDIPCQHPTWNVLNKVSGCIHSDHGPFPFPLADHHSGLRLVDSIPTRYVPVKP